MRFSAPLPLTPFTGAFQRPSFGVAISYVANGGDFDQEHGASVPEKRRVDPSGTELRLPKKCP